MALILLALNFHIQSCHPTLGHPPRGPRPSSRRYTVRRASSASTPHVIVLCPLHPPSPPLSPPLSSSLFTNSPSLPPPTFPLLFYPFPFGATSVTLPLVRFRPRGAPPFYIGFSNPYGFENVAVTFKRIERSFLYRSGCYVAFGLARQMSVITRCFVSFLVRCAEMLASIETISRIRYKIKADILFVSLYLKSTNTIQALRKKYKYMVLQRLLKLHII